MNKLASKLSNSDLLQPHTLINGEWVGANNQATFAVLNPSTGEELNRIADIGVEQTKQAITKAHAAGPAWAALSAVERSGILRRWYELVVQNKEDLAIITTAEMGKPLAESRAEASYSANFIEWYAEESKRVYGDIIPSPHADKRLIVIKQPIGVVAAITPWNFPLAMVTRKIAPAIAVGCTVVFKPAEQTPLAAIALMRLAEQAGLPSGVCNLITSNQPIEVGSELCTNPLVRAISFTGSTEVGRIIMRKSASTIKRVGLELGGNASFIVFDDADIEAAAEGAILSKFRNAGQTCVCSNRIYVQKGIYQTFSNKLAEKIKKLKVGDGFTQGVQIGPLIDQQGLNKVQNHLDDAIGKGAQLVCGGKQHQMGGTFFTPTLLTDVDDSMQITTEETFGPIAPLLMFNDEDEVIKRANAVSTGLVAYLYSRDLTRIWRTAEKLETGMVGVNTGHLSTEVAPFGGIKQSGLGREGSRYGVDEYIELKYICLGGM